MLHQFPVGLKGLNQPPPCREEPGMFAGTQNFNRDKDSGKQLVAKKYPQSLEPEINEGPNQ